MALNFFKTTPDIINLKFIFISLTRNERKSLIKFPVPLKNMSNFLTFTN